MRILTVRQPWAQMIADGHKHVENRVRNIAGDYRGLVAIHAGAREDVGAREHPEVQRIARDIWWTDPASLHVGQPRAFGHILAVANLWAVHHHDGTPGMRCCPNAPERYTRWAEPDVWHLCFSSPRKLAEPIPFKGALGLRTLPADVEAAIREQVK
jgi:hypothetical protein